MAKHRALSRACWWSYAIFSMAIFVLTTTTHTMTQPIFTLPPCACTRGKYSNKVACIVLRWNSIHSLCTIRKLWFLHRVKTNEESICYRTYAAMIDDIEALSLVIDNWDYAVLIIYGLVRECRELEERYGSDFTTQILESADHPDGTMQKRNAHCVTQTNPTYVCWNIL